MDTGTAKTFNTWYESGLPGGAGGGCPGGRRLHRAADPSAQFLLAPYTGPNALFLGQDNPTGTLTFATPAAFHELTILTSSGLGTSTSPVLGLTLHFADGTSAISGLSVVSPDWFNNGPAALIRRGRVNVDTGLFNSLGADNPRIYQESVNLPDGEFGHRSRASPSTGPAARPRPTRRSSASAARRPSPPPPYSSARGCWACCGWQSNVPLIDVMTLETANRRQ